MSALAPAFPRTSRTIQQAYKPLTSSYPDFVPANYTELFDHYYTYVRGLVFRSGIDAQNCNDVAMSILEKFFANDVLADFNPEFTSHHGGVARKAMFRTFLSGFVKIYVRHHRERQMTHKSREIVFCDSPSAINPTSSWLEINGPAYEEKHDQLMIGDLVDTVRDHLRSLSGETAGRCDLIDLFDATLEHAVTYGKPNIEILAQYFEVSETTVRNRLAQMRVEIHEVFLA